MLDIIDDRTPNEQLALPHPRNRLEQDVLRLRDALLAIDGTLLTIFNALQEKAASSDLAIAMNALQQGINGLSTTVNTLQQNKVGVVNGKPGPAVTLTPADIGALAVGQYGFGASQIPVCSGANLNDLEQVTMLVFGANFINGPPGSYFVVHQLVHYSAYIMQIAYSMIDSSRRVFSRQKIGGVWDSTWTEISGRPLTGYVNDTSGHMYGDDTPGKQGLGMVNVWNYGGQIRKYAPQPLSDGDVFSIVITNGRLDNEIYATASGIKVMGMADYVVLDRPGPYTFKYFQALNDWRLF